MYHISGFSDHGEARITDADGRLVGYGKLNLEAYTRPETGSTFPLELKVTWVKEDDLESLFNLDIPGAENG